MIRLVLMPLAGFAMLLPFLDHIISDGLINLTILIQSVRSPNLIFPCP